MYKKNTVNREYSIFICGNKEEINRILRVKKADYYHAFLTFPNSKNIFLDARKSFSCHGIQIRFIITM